MLHWLIPYIQERGSISVYEYMELCLYHPEFGYYTTRNPLGGESDFLTAPETSQMFGEMIGVCLQDLWHRMGEPAVHLVEVGPGQGTLMQDLLRIVPQDFLGAMDLHLVDVSPVLMGEQQKRITHPNACWYKTLDEALKKCLGPTFIIANELYDALPIHQQVRTKDGWQERCVAVIDGALDFTPEGTTIKEHCPLAQTYMGLMSDHMAQYGGMALCIDYGYVGPAVGDTLQALRQHKFHDVLKDPGQADLTAHVDFGALMAAAKCVNVFGPVAQGRFLFELGIMLRAEGLKKNATFVQLQQIDRALHRLLDEGQMGELFKVMAITGEQTPMPAGFSSFLQECNTVHHM